MDIVQQMRDIAPTLTRKQRMIVDYLCENPFDVCYLTLKQLSEKTHVSELTILRLCAQLGFNSFIALKNAFRTYQQSTIQHTWSPGKLFPAARETAEKLATLRATLDAETGNLQAYSSEFAGEQYLQAARDILSARTVVLVGNEVSHLLCKYMATRLNLLNLPCVVLKAEDAPQIQAQLALLSTKDLVFGISFPDYSIHTVSFARYVRSRGLRVLSITDTPDNPLAQASDTVLLCNTHTRLIYNSMATPITAISLLASAIALEMSDERRAEAVRARELTESLSSVDRTYSTD